MISTVMLVLGLGLGLEPQVLVNITVQERNHAFKVGGPVPWSRVLLPFYRKNRSTQFGAINYIITLYSSKCCVKLGGTSKFFGGPDLPDPPVVTPMIV